MAISVEEIKQLRVVNGVVMVLEEGIDRKLTEHFVAGGKAETMIYSIPANLSGGIKVETAACAQIIATYGKKGWEVKLERGTLCFKLP